MTNEEIKAKLQAIQLREGETLYDVLTSPTVFTALRFATKSPSTSGVDNHEDDGYWTLYNLILSLPQSK